MNFQEALKTLTNETGWTMPKAGADGVFRFHLEDGLDFALHSPDGRLCILTSDMGEAPSENEPDYAEKSDRLGMVCAALMPYGRARLCADSGRLQLVRDFSLDGLSGAREGKRGYRADAGVRVMVLGGEKRRRADELE